jgi:signal transduction histidine kinase
LHELLEETLQLMRPELEESGIEPEYYPPSVHTTVFADRIDLRKAFVNIIKNSLEAMPNGGRLTIKIRVEEATVSITFEDTGTGIDESILDRIYEVGFSTKDIGSGLGLAQVDRCIHEHYGTIDIDSEKGEGTRIQITLPVLTQGKKLLGVTTPSETVPTDP